MATSFPPISTDRKIADDDLATLTPGVDYTGRLEIMDSTGDTKHIWNRNNTEEVSVMRDLFNTLKRRGYAIFKVEGKEGERGEVMHEFDPRAERMIASPAPVGG